eukprot:CAMPEP_0118975286 /NCGR_PEP_ID=MMETSP1173-20130426/15342_1 /TAXON_ID=1034831 /ORGANISM="Rhizochromulina marina cf, Strain CCMP1243" /LENGTH=40 /DNA_ID= /DNA_START= /DNA_END= /DNA_ORIENTATION=
MWWGRVDRRYEETRNPTTPWCVGRRQLFGGGVAAWRRLPA